MTAQGSARSVFKRAIERGNVVVAEIAARELGRLDLSEALELTALIAKRDPRVRGRRASARWLRSWSSSRYSRSESWSRNETSSARKAPVEA